jgi:hypothetical protein
MRTEDDFLKRNVSPRAAVLTVTLSLCVVVAIAFHKFREPPQAVSTVENSETLETPEVMVQVPREFLETPKEFLETDVTALISIRQPDDVERVRAALTAFLWGDQGLPSTVPEEVSQDFSDVRYADLSSLDSIDKLIVRMDFGLESHIYHFRPKSPNNKAVLFHQGHRGDFFLSKVQIGTFLDHGYSVLAFSMPLLGLNNQPIVQLPRFGNLQLIDHDSMKFLVPENGHPLQYFVEPVIAAINYLEQNHSYSSISMVGISGGGWTTTIVAAFDTRIKKSFPVAGSYPVYLRSNSLRDWGDYEQTHPAFYRNANYLELYALGAYGSGRMQLQVINQFDACCFAGTKWDTYVDKVKALVIELGSGEFKFYLDASHTEHALSSATMDRILSELG